MINLVYCIVMNNSELIAELTNRLQWTNGHVSLALQAMADAISDKLSENKIIVFSNFGLFCTEKKAETIHIDEATGQRFLYPPAIVASFFIHNSPDFQLIVGSNETNNLANMLLAKSELSREETHAFLNELQHIITSTGESDCVTIDNLGTFENLSFVPDDSLKESVNKPFAHFEAVLLHDEFNVENIESVQVNNEKDEKPAEEKSESNLQKAAEEASKVIEYDTREEKSDNKTTKQQIFSTSDKNRSTSGVLYFIAGGLLLAATALLQNKKRT